MPGRGWLAAIELKAGTRVQLVNGEYRVVDRAYSELLDSPVTVYNFEVEGFHTYFVSELGVLVHNTCSSGNAKQFTNNPSRNAAFRSAKRDAGIPMSQQPNAVYNSVNKIGQPIPGRTYEFRVGNNNVIRIFEHSTGHPEYGIGPHFNSFINKNHYLFPRG